MTAGMLGLRLGSSWSPRMFKYKEKTPSKDNKIHQNLTLYLSKQ